MKFGQLIEYNMRNIFFKNHTQNVVDKLFPDPFLKNKNWSYLWMNSLTFYRVCFYCIWSCRLSIYVLKLSCAPLTFTSIITFLKSKNRSGTSLPASYSAWFLKSKYLSCYILLTDKISLSGCYYFVRYWAICDVECNCLLTRLWRRFWN